MKEKNLAKTYSPKAFEDRIYEEWEQKDLFRASIREDQEPYTIIMPPPNITGQLHMGHALDHTLQDVLIRWKRLQGYSALWLPGSDHASIATEVKVVEKLREEEGKEKEDIGREAFLERAWEWKRIYGGKITQQYRKLGDSCDWSRERFTMDQGCSESVKTMFIKLYEKGLIYRGNRLINWCPKCGTSLSDAEVEHEDKLGKYWYFRYPALDGGQGIVVATSRPETIFGDVAIAVHPEDERYKHLIGTKVVIPLVGREIPIIADEYPDPTKGTGAVKITPAHDPNDFEVGKRHKLESPCCIEKNGTMGELAGKYQGLDRYQCRKEWVADLEKAGYLVKTEELTIPVGGCYRCSTVVEPMLSDQWFVAMENLAKPALEVAKTGELKHVPERFTKIYTHWLENIRDWCISRQLWWGHRIPAYYCQECNEIMVCQDEPKTCTSCGSQNLEQDPDVLDTWFSSALWPFSTLGWPNETEDFKYFYPTNVLVTGYDIIFFWVVRMVFSAIEATGKIPFDHVYVHGLVRDSQGRKMSKSLGNGIDPLDVIEEYGADALRFMLSTGISPGSDIRFMEEKIEAARNFANKLWNASRFVIMNLQDEEGEFLPMASKSLDENQNVLRDEDKWIISRVNEASKYVTDSLEKFELALGGQRVYETIWNQYCDWYIEIVKGRLYGDNKEDKEIVRRVLVETLKDLLRMLHPFMPFITEEIWSYLPETQGNMLMKDSWPIYSKDKVFSEETERLELAQEVIRAIRNIRVEVNVQASKPITAYILAEKPKLTSCKSGEEYIKKLANVTEILYLTEKSKLPEEAASAVITGAEIFVPLDELLDYKEEKERLEKERNKLQGEVDRSEKMLSNQGFVAKAPREKIQEEKSKLDNYKLMLNKVVDRLVEVEKKL